VSPAHDATKIVVWMRQELDRERTNAGEVWVRPICAAFESGSVELATVRCLRFLHNVVPRDRDERLFDALLTAREEPAQAADRLAEVNWPERIDRGRVTSALERGDFETAERELHLQAATRLRVYGKWLLEALGTGATEH
jgi:hypothetical protein